jgi:hypothetical protein
MCSTLEMRLAMLRAAIDEVALAARADRAGHTDPGDLAKRLAALWAMIAELDPALAARLRGYGPDADWDSPLCRHRAVVTGVSSRRSRSRGWRSPRGAAAPAPGVPRWS